MICPVCNKQFEPTGRNQINCSSKCTKKKWNLKNKYYFNQYRKTHSRNQERSNAVKTGAVAYNQIRQRCNNKNHPSYSAYGAKGIQCRITLEEFRIIYFSSNKCHVCDKSLEDHDRRIQKHARTIDRIDKVKHYEIGNLRLLCRSCNSSIRKEAQ